MRLSIILAVEAKTAKGGADGKKAKKKKDPNAPKVRVDIRDNC